MGHKKMNMNMFDICRKVKKTEVEKVAFSLKLPKHLKAKLDLVCQTEGVSANSFIVALLDEILTKDLKND